MAQTVSRQEFMAAYKQITQAFNKVVNAAGTIKDRALQAERKLLLAEKREAYAAIKEIFEGEKMPAQKLRQALNKAVKKDYCSEVVGTHIIRNIPALKTRAEEKSEAETVKTIRRAMKKGQ